MLSLFSLAVLFFVTCVTHSTPVSRRAIKLAGRASPTQEHHGAWTRELRAIEASKIVETYKTRDFHPIPLALRRSKARGARGRVTSIPLEDYVVNGADLLYHGNLKIGTPAQELEVWFDTGSWDLWLASTCGANYASGYFKTAASSTYRNTGRLFNATYGSGSASGTIASDNVALGSLEVHEQFFGAVTTIAAEFSGIPAAGIMGLSFSAMAKTGKPTFIDNAIRLHELANNVFGVYLGRGKKTGSELTIGGIDVTHYTGVITETPVISTAYWAVQATGATVSGKHVSAGVAAIIDTGTTQIFVPTAMAAKIYAAIPGASIDKADSSNSATYYQYPCRSSPSVGFLFAGSSRQFTIDPQDFNLGPVDSTKKLCFGGVVGHDVEVGGIQLAVFGDGFLKSWYSIYSYNTETGRPTVGFAKSRA